MTSYLIIGGGRLAKHIAYYLGLLDIPFEIWSRKKSVSELAALAESAERILILISDGEIARFVQEHPFLLEKKLIHCSGVLTFPFAESAHPLNTFGPDLYDKETYTQTPFIIEKGRSDFVELLPGLPNPHFVVSPEKKALYHSLCVMSGNFTTLLWQNVFEIFEAELKLPKETLFPFLKTTLKNLKKSAPNALTGPLARGDTQTIIRNLDALHGRPEQTLYYAFLNYVLEKRKNLGELKYERLGF